MDMSRPFACPFCGQLFTRSENLKRHKRTRHGASGFKTFECQLCHAIFGRRDICKRHQERCDGQPTLRRAKMSSDASSVGGSAGSVGGGGGSSVPSETLPLNPQKSETDATAAAAAAAGIPPLNNTRQLDGGLDYLLDAARSLEPAPDNNNMSSSNLLSPETATACIASYFAHFHPSFPILHRPTFSPDRAPQSLVYIVAAIGNLYRCRTDPSALTQDVAQQQKSNDLWEACVASLHNISISDPGRWKDIWILQTSLLCIVYGAFATDRLSQTRQMLTRLVSDVREGGLFQQHSCEYSYSWRQDLDARIELGLGLGLTSTSTSMQMQMLTPMPTQPDDTWRSFIDEESLKLSLYGLTMIDLQLVLACNARPEISALELVWDMPWSTAAWEANTAQEWVQQMHMEAASYQQQQQPQQPQQCQQGGQQGQQGQTPLNGPTANGSGSGGGGGGGGGSNGGSNGGGPAVGSFANFNDRGPGLKSLFLVTQALMAGGGPPDAVLKALTYSHFALLCVAVNIYLIVLGFTHYLYQLPPSPSNPSPFHILTHSQNSQINTALALLLGLKAPCLAAGNKNPAAAVTSKCLWNAAQLVCWVAKISLCVPDDFLICGIVDTDITASFATAAHLSLGTQILGRRSRNCTAPQKPFGFGEEGFLLIFDELMNTVDSLWGVEAAGADPGTGGSGSGTAPAPNAALQAMAEAPWVSVMGFRALLDMYRVLRLATTDLNERASSVHAPSQSQSHLHSPPRIFDPAKIVYDTVNNALTQYIRNRRTSLPTRHLEQLGMLELTEDPKLCERKFMMIMVQSCKERNVWPVVRSVGGVLEEIFTSSL